LIVSANEDRIWSGLGLAPGIWVRSSKYASSETLGFSWLQIQHLDIAWLGLFGEISHWTQELKMWQRLQEVYLGDHEELE